MLVFIFLSRGRSIAVSILVTLSRVPLLRRVPLRAHTVLRVQAVREDAILSETTGAVSLEACARWSARWAGAGTDDRRGAKRCSATQSVQGCQERISTARWRAKTGCYRLGVRINLRGVLRERRHLARFPAEHRRKVAVAARTALTSYSYLQL